MFATWLVSIFSIAMSVLFFWTSFSLVTLRADPGGPAIVPQILCVITILSALASLVMVVRKQDGIGQLKASVKSFFSQFSEGIRAEKAEAPRVGVVMVLSAIYPVAITGFGFVLATVALVGILCWICRLKPLRTLILMIVVPGFIYWLFNDVMKARVPQGEIFDILMLL